MVFVHWNLRDPNFPKGRSVGRSKDWTSRGSFLDHRFTNEHSDATRATIKRSFLRNDRRAWRWQLGAPDVGHLHPARRPRGAI